MKKITAIILCIVLAFALIGCGSKAVESPKEESSISTGGSFSKGGSKAEEPVSVAEEPVSVAEEPVSVAEEPVSEAEEPVSEVEEPASEETSTEGNPFALIAGEYHLSALVTDGTDTYESLKDFIAAGVFDEWVIITEEGKLMMYSVSRLEEGEEDAEPQSLGDYNITYDPATNEIVVTDFAATDETISCDGTVLIIDSPKYHMEFTKR